MDQQPGQVGIELTQVHWLWAHLGRQRLRSVQLLQDPSGCQGGHSQAVIYSGRSPAPEELPAPAETAYFSSFVMGAPYREVNSKVATGPKLTVEDKDRVNTSRRIKMVKLNIVKLKASLNKFSREKVGYRSRMKNA